MKKIALIALALILIIGLMTGCRRQPADETTTPTGNETVMPTMTTARPTTRPTTAPTTESTRGTTDATNGTEDMIPSQTGTNGSEPGGTSRGNRIMPHQ